ncbi:hypothetical protein Tco_0259670 [Tanacetum coccineum]
MDANKKIDLDNLLYPNESKIMANIIQNHLLRFSIAASTSVPWIYLGQFWHTLQEEDGSKYRLKFVLDQKEITMTFNDFRRIFHLPQAIDNNHERFVAALKSPSNFKTTGLVQPWQTLGKTICSISLLRESLGHDQLPFAQYADVNTYHLGKHKDDVGMKIPSWMITDEIKLMDHYQMYDVVFGVDFPMTQSHPIESTQGTHRTISASRSPNPETNEGESSALRKYTVIRLYTIQLSLAKQKSLDELEAKKNVQKAKKHLIAEEIKKLVEEAYNVENVVVNSSILRQDDTQNILGTRLEPRSDKESPEVEITAKVQPVNIDEDEEKLAKDDYELKRREKGKHV